MLLLHFLRLHKNLAESTRIWLSKGDLVRENKLIFFRKEDLETLFGKKIISGRATRYYQIIVCLINIYYTNSDKK